VARRIETEILIQAKASDVWRALMDFASYETWNPFMSSIDGKPLVGERLVVRFRKGFTFKPIVTERNDAHTFEWLGKLFFGGLFDGRHRFELVDAGEQTKLVHSEEFSGVLVPFLGKMLDETKQDFASFNEALKARVEGGAHG
jgi:hypothetical protein